MTHSKGVFRGLNPLGWGLWPVMVIWAGYETRFWINNDTIGSLDVARFLILGLIFSLVHGIGAMVYASVRQAPQGEHVAMALCIKDRRGSHEDPGPLGVFLYPQANLYHHGVIAYPLKTKTAELAKLNDKMSFSASFIPKIVLLVLGTDDAVPQSVAVNGKPFGRANSWVWGKL
jgi:hypothetical protein